MFTSLKLEKLLLLKLSHSQVVTEPKFMERSSLLEGAFAKKQYSEFYEHKIQSSETEEDKNLWSFLKVYNMLVFFCGSY